MYYNEAACPRRNKKSNDKNQKIYTQLRKYKLNLLGMVHVLFGILSIFVTFFLSQFFGKFTIFITILLE